MRWPNALVGCFTSFLKVFDVHLAGSLTPIQRAGAYWHCPTMVPWPSSSLVVEILLDRLMAVYLSSWHCVNQETLWLVIRRSRILAFLEAQSCLAFNSQDSWSEYTVFKWSKRNMVNFSFRDVWNSFTPRKWWENFEDLHSWTRNSQLFKELFGHSVRIYDLTSCGERVAAFF